MGEVGYTPAEINQMRWQIYRQFAPIKQKLALLYQELVESNVFWGETLWAEMKVVTDILCDSTVLFETASETQEQCKRAREEVEERGDGIEKRISLLESLFEIAEEMENMIRKKAKRCNACKNEVFFTPIPAVYETRRRQYGFPFWNADFQLESRENYGCPICGAYDRDRLIIAFLEEVQACEGERLRMLQIAPSRAIERYALGRKDIQYESTDLMMPGVTFQADLQHMDMVGDETYDIIVCAHVLEHVENDTKAMGELHRIMKPDGVCLVLVPLIVGNLETDEQWGCGAEENWRRFGQGDHSRLYGKEDFIRRLRRVGFQVNELGKEWFGEDFYDAYGFDDLSILYVATKEVILVEQTQEDLARRLADLQNENRLLREALKDINGRLTALQKTVDTNFMISFHTLDNLGWEINDRRFREKLWYPQVMSTAETVKEIIEHKKSIARFGDGEFGIIAGVQRWRFQKADEGLSHRLLEVLQSENDRILIGISDMYGDLSAWGSKAANGARIYLTPEVRQQHYALLKRDRMYANARISRITREEEFKTLKKIWDGRDCVFIEGFQTRMGVGNDLFENAKSIVRILCPAENAYERYQEIYSEAVKQPRDKLCLIALGPTASVLAYDLAVQGYQAVDIGHADISYEWLRLGNHGRVANKYSNEAPMGYIVDEVHDAEYESQIIADLHE